jgi:hypothetical protein
VNDAKKCCDGAVAGDRFSHNSWYAVALMLASRFCGSGGSRQKSYCAEEEQMLLLPGRFADGVRRRLRESDEFRVLFAAPCGPEPGPVRV